MEQKIEINDIGSKGLSFSTGLLAKQANGSVLVAYGDTVVLGNVCMSKEPTSSQGFFPLMVDYQERAHSAGKFPGGYLKREGRPKEKEILTARLIDRPLRPLFPKGLSNEVQIIAMTLSSDAQYDSDVLAINAASAALMVSDIPFDNPIGAVRVAKIDGKFIVNPSFDEREKSVMNFVIVGTQERIVMLEGDFKEITETEAFETIEFAHSYIRKIIEGQNELKAKAGKPKKDVPLALVDPDLLAMVKEKAYSKIEKAYGTFDKEALNAVIKESQAELVADLITEDSKITEADIAFHLHEAESECLRNNVINNELRPDGRKINEVRKIECKAGLLPRTHGSALFTRGQTQALAITTLGSGSDEQSIETLQGEDSKHFMLHYNFPPFSVGEVKFMRGPSRRDIGHGMLAEKALSAVVPGKKEFPYTKKVVSEILESNGSS
ncbi:MAG: polyribonucleotide nucleotidyltransferase, partial [Candidatus Omnitrophota bacterium]